MYHDLPRAARFWTFLLAIDQDLAEATRKKGCPCGGRLHCANYLRKPRGTHKQLPEQQRVRLSFCCDRDGCRRRVTPHSVRFLGPKVYLGVVVITISAMRQGPTPRRVRDLAARFKVDRRTIARWQVFWREHFPQTPLWKAARARLVPVVKIVDLPYSLVEAFLRRRAPCQRRLTDGANNSMPVHAPFRRCAPYTGWKRLLRFLAPITSKSALPIEISH